MKTLELFIFKLTYNNKTVLFVVSDWFTKTLLFAVTSRNSQAIYGAEPQTPSQIK